MNVLDTFYILFKSNSDDVKRGLDTVNKKAKETEDNLRNTNEEASKLGHSFVKMVESGATLIGAYGGFQVVKAGVVAQTEYNQQLLITSKLYKQNAGDLKAFAQAAYQAGGSKEGALSDMIGYSQLAQQRGLKYSPLQQMLAARARYQSLANSPVAQAQMLTGANAYYQDPGLQNMLQMSNEKFNELLGTKGVKAAGSLTETQAQQAFDAVATQRDLEGSINKVETTISSTLTPSINKLTDKISALTSTIGGSPAGSIAAGATVGGGAAMAARAVARAVAGRAAVGEAAAAAGGVGMAGLAGEALMFGGGGVLAGYGLVGAFGDKIEKYLVAGMSDPTPPGLAKATHKRMSAMQFWMSQGYSKNQAAGIVSNMMRESGGDPSRSGDGGKAKGLFQWHKTRRDAILKATGIDVWNSSGEDQMKAAAWEMKNGNVGFSDKAYRGIGPADQAGSYFSSHFEYPRDKYGEMMLRGKNALTLASSYQAPVTVGTANVTIGAININAPGSDATEIAKHIHDATRKQLSIIQAQADNGRSG